MTKHRLGTIQSFRPGYGALMPQSALYGKRVADFQRPDQENIVLKRHFEKWRNMALSAIPRNGTGSRARTYDLRFWRPPLYQLSYARIVRMSAQQALPKSFRTLCKERFASKRALTPTRPSGSISSSRLKSPTRDCARCRPPSSTRSVLKRHSRQAAAGRVQAKAPSRIPEVRMRTSSATQNSRPSCCSSQAR